MEKLYSTKELAVELGLTTRRIQQIAAALGIEKDGQDLRIPAALVEHFRSRPGRGRRVDPDSLRQIRLSRQAAKAAKAPAPK